MKFFITFEGIEGCGKTTQTTLLKDFLEKRGFSVVATREPGGTRIGEDIRKILLDSGNVAIDSKTELLLYEASRAQHIKEVIKPALERGSVVLCDRFTDATLAYQGFAQGIPREMAETLNHFATDSLIPDLTILIDCPVALGLRRARERGETLHQENSEDRIEEKHAAFHQKVRQGYLQIAEHSEGRMFIIDGRRTPSDMHQDIRTVVLKKMEA